jgi:plastocyanin
MLLVVSYGCGGKEAAPESSEVKETPAPAGSVAVPTSGAKITGMVKLTGDAPKMRDIDMSDEPVCVHKWEEWGMVSKSETLVLGEGQSIANIFVSIKSGLSAQNYTPPADPVVVNQEGCAYIPHVFAAMKGQKIIFKNSDGVLHNVHALPEKNREFNLAMPGSMTDAPPRSFKKVEPMFRIKCDKHPWMLSYAAVMSHPYFSVTGVDGKFEISGVPAGTYEVEAWHEKLGTQVSTVTVAADSSETVDFAFSR